MQRSATVDGSFTGGTRVGSGGALAPGQTMSAPGHSPGSTPLTSQTQATAMRPATGSSPAVPGRASSGVPVSALSGAYVAEACAKDPSYRVLGVSGASDGKTLTIGPQYTIWGCSFGTLAAVKPVRPPSSLGQNQTVRPTYYAVAIYSTPFKRAWFVYADIQSWSDNSIVITISPSAAVYPGASVAGMDLPAGVWLTRGDGETTICWGLFFRPERVVPPGANLNGGGRVGSGGTLGAGQTMSAQGTSPASVSAQSNLAKLPPIHSTPQRDAARPADPAARTEMKKRVETQVATFTQSAARSTSAASTQALGEVAEVQSLKRQKMFVETLRNQSGVMLPTIGAQQTGTLPKTGSATGSAAASTPSLLPPPAGKPAVQQAPTSAAQHQQHTGLNPKFSESANAKLCLTTQIYNVNGVNSAANAVNPVVFTQDPANNDYIISGCGFGSQEGGQVYLSGAITGGRINMTVLQWTPTMIEAVVQRDLKGVLDGWPDLIVVPPGGGQPAKFPNCRFYAQRQRVLLPNIPQNYARLANVQVGDGTHGGGVMYCPGPDVTHLFPCISFNAGPPLDGVTNEPSLRGQTSTPVSNAVDRDGGQLQFSAGEDVYELTSLAPGFAIDGFYANWYAWSASTCKGWAAEGDVKFGDSLDYNTDGHYQFYRKGNYTIVDWGVDHCALRFLGTKIFGNDEYNSGYSLTVHVAGPIGVDPWTGQPVKN